MPVFFCLGRRAGTAVELLPCSAGGPGSIPTTGVACTKFVPSPRDRLGFLQDLRFPPTLKSRAGMYVNWLGKRKNCPQCVQDNVDLRGSLLSVVSMGSVGRRACFRTVSLN